MGGLQEPGGCERNLGASGGEVNVCSRPRAPGLLHCRSSRSYRAALARPLSFQAAHRCGRHSAPRSVQMSLRAAHRCGRHSEPRSAQMSFRAAHRGGCHSEPRSVQMSFRAVLARNLAFRMQSIPHAARSLDSVAQTAAPLGMTMSRRRHSAPQCAAPSFRGGCHSEPRSAQMSLRAAHRGGCHSEPRSAQMSFRAAHRCGCHSEPRSAQMSFRAAHRRGCHSEPYLRGISPFEYCPSPHAARSLDSAAQTAAPLGMTGHRITHRAGRDGRLEIAVRDLPETAVRERL